MHNKPDPSCWHANGLANLSAARTIAKDILPSMLIRALLVRKPATPQWMASYNMGKNALKPHSVCCKRQSKRRYTFWQTAGCKAVLLQQSRCIGRHLSKTITTNRH
ncbi:hypothetical protein [Noviherbaspirillum sp.]|uniref:hypothetical protein n=1 Tax=Noviherbaspirillum sp. TaxID=1926288 RepID=UPI002FE3E0B8